MTGDIPPNVALALLNATSYYFANVSAPNLTKKMAQNRTMILVNFTDAGGLNLNSTTVDTYNLSLLFRRPGVSTTTTIPPSSYCGRTAVYCSVENDNDADAKPDCCGIENNPVCMGCFSECIVKCAERGVGVKTCFVAKDIGPVCQCSPLPPNCYDMPVIATTSTLTMISSRGDNSLVYVLAGAVLLVGAAVAVKFSHGAGGV